MHYLPATVPNSEIKIYLSKKEPQKQDISYINITDIHAVSYRFLNESSVNISQQSISITLMDIQIMIKQPTCYTLNHK